jgi:hypothetical protein
MALDHVGQRFCGPRLDRRVGSFSWYASNFGSYNQTYGSLEAVIGIMVWLWIFHDRRSCRSSDQCRDRAAVGTQHDAESQSRGLTASEANRP